MRNVLVLVLAVAACAGDEVDPGNGPVCSKAAYDSCLTEHDCDSGRCKFFDDMTVCTQSCSAAEPCPDFMGEPVACNAQSLCEPPAENACRVVP